MKVFTVCQIVKVSHTDPRRRIHGQTVEIVISIHASKESADKEVEAGDGSSYVQERTVID